MKVHVIGQTWEASVTGGWHSATDYIIPDDTPLNRDAVRIALAPKLGDFRYIEDFCVPDQLWWEEWSSEDIYLDCMCGVMPDDDQLDRLIQEHQA